MAATDPTRLVVSRRPILLALLVSLALPLATAHAEDPPAPEPPAPIEPAPPEPTPLSVAPDLQTLEGPWRPPIVDPEAKDWIRLTSGEWVRGEIEYVHDEVVYFDSDKLDDLEIDWDDVAGFRSAHRNTYRFGNVIVTGTAAMRDGVIRVDTGSEVREFLSSDLLTMIEGDLSEINYWSLNLAFGLTMRAGNSDQRDTSTRLEIKRETPLTRLDLTYASAYSVVESDEVTNNQRVNGEFAYYVSRRFFLLAPTAEAYRDRIQNIDLRATIGAGVGYDILDRARAKWNVVIGAGYQRTQFDDVQPGEDRTDHDAAAIFGMKIELDPWKDVDWDTDYNLQAVVTDPDKTNHHLTSVLSVDIWGPLDLDTTFVWDRIEGPTPDEDGEVPARDDFRLVVGIALDL